MTRSLVADEEIAAGVVCTTCRVAGSGKTTLVRPDGEGETVVPSWP